MKIILGSDPKGSALKEILAEYLSKKGYDVVNCEVKQDFFEASCEVVKLVSQNISENKGIIIDEYGAGSFMTAAKFKGIICAQLNDEHSAKMTRDHNNANVITMGSAVVGVEVAKRIAERFTVAEYSGGRHQIRVDMLDRMI